MVGETKPTEKPAEEDLVWKKEELKWQIRSLENQIFVAQKQHGDVTTVVGVLNSAIKEFAGKNFSEAEEHVLNVKKGLIEIIHTLKLRWRLAYFASVWGLFPIGTAILAMFISFIWLHSYSYIILGIGVPLWAPLVAVIGASVQILVGIVKDIKEDSMISQYKRLWYLVLPFVSFVFGFIAILLIQAGLFNMSQGQLGSVRCYSNKSNYNYILHHS
ncbi:MAG: hypothetical protein Q8O41_08300 [Candidatus Methanoperedens sp.]|nr:hypothetical protein [Candidatus Methanoperedens sp.]